MHNPLKTAAQSARKARTGLRATLSRDNLKRLFTQRSFTSGGYTAVSCLIAIALAAGAVAAVEALPASWTQIDISEQQTTSLSDSSKEYLRSLEDDVTIYLVAEEGSEDEYLSILLEKVADASDRVSVVQRDPVLYPAFTSEYTDEELEDNSLIITCGDDYRVVAYSDIYTLNYSTYSYDFSGESAIVSAITAMTSDDLPTVYALAGHGESTLPTDLSDDLDTANMSVSELNLLSEGTVPDDADAVIMYDPSTDLSDDEKNALLDYLEAGGSFLLMTDYLDESLTNLAEVMDSYGLQAQEGLVVEGSAGHYLNGYPYYLLPTIGSHDATGDLATANSYVLVPLAHGIAEVEHYRSSLTVTPLLETSEAAYIKADPETAETLSQEDGDTAGATMVGVAVEEELDDGATTRIVWFSSTEMLDTQVDMRVGGANTALVTSSISWLADADETTTALSGKSLSTSMLTVDESVSSALSVILIAIVPAFFLLFGFQTWRSRRRS